MEKKTDNLQRAVEGMQKRIADAVRAALEGEADKMRAQALGLLTSTNDNAPSMSLTMTEQWVREIERAYYEVRRNQTLITVDLAHPGPPIWYQTPCDGMRVEMSWPQANELHQHWPLVMVEVLNQTAAIFRPASLVFPDRVTKDLPLPPYEVKLEE